MKRQRNRIQILYSNIINQYKIIWFYQLRFIKRHKDNVTKNKNKIVNHINILNNIKLFKERKNTSGRFDR